MQSRHPLAPQPEALPILRAVRDSKPHGTIQGGHLDLATQDDRIQVFRRAIAHVDPWPGAFRRAELPAAPIKVAGLARLLVTLPLGAQLIILAALFRVGKDLAGFVEFSEAFLGLGIVRVDVWVNLARQSLECLAYLFLISF